MTKKIHIALSTSKIDESIADYTQRFGQPPCSATGEYALWRTDVMNLSIRLDASVPPGQLRHLGFEDPAAPTFSEDTDVNGIVWEHFSAEQQATEINEFWPEAEYVPAD